MPSIDRERWQRIEAILDEVLDLDPESRADFLDRACGGDDELRGEVERLLAADSDAGDFLGTPAGEVAAELVAEDDDTPSFAGRRLGPYSVLRRLGAGGMGEVYEAHDDRLDRTVAIKVLPPAWSRDAGAKERFLREARAASALDHPNICTVHDVGDAPDGQLYIVMAYYPGETLAQKLARGPLEIADARSLAVQVARGLARAHEAGITHRDVKPANVVVTDRGEAKVLDFGIAKVAGDAGLTRTGVSPGTPAYMSPEQVRGRSVDGRTDVWSLGVVLYEMLAGRRPFAGDDPQAAFWAVAHEEPESLRELRPEVPEELAAVVRKAMAKDPEARYPTMAAMLADLETGTAPLLPAMPSTAAVTPHRRPRAWVAGIAGTAAAVLLLLAGWWALERRPPPVSEAPPDDGRTSLAVLYFQNLTGDPELEWLRSGLADMLVTDLSQSPGLELLSTGRLLQVLKDLDALEQPNLSLATLRGMAEEAGVEAVVRGSFAQVGKVLRVTFTVEETSSGRIVESETLEGRGQESLFALADELAAAVRNRFEVVRPAGFPETVTEITTRSLAAWRLYSEGITLQRTGQNREAIALLERAVEVDPTFALALADLGRFHANLGQTAEERRYAGLALEHAERLPLNLRTSIEEAYYGARWATYPRAVEALERALGTFPGEPTHRHNLALYLTYHERLDEALAQYDHLFADGWTFPPAYASAANAYLALGRPESGLRILSELLERDPENGYTHLALGWFLSHWGHLDEAEAHLRKAAEKRPGDVNVPYTRWRIAVLREDWTAAAREAERTAAQGDAYARWRGAVSAAHDALYHGRGRDALERFDEAMAASGEPEATTALARAWRAELLLALGDAEEALAQALIAAEEGRDEWPELQALGVAALAAETLGRSTEADDLAARLRKAWEEHPNKVEERHLYRVEGLLALRRGDAGDAVGMLRRAAALLPARGVEIHWHALPDHVPIWSAKGEAELAAGLLEDARRSFEEVATSGAEHIDFPVPYVRAFYHLGDVHRRLGEDALARGHFARFLSFWRDGDLDRDRVEGAERAKAGAI